MTGVQTCALPIYLVGLSIGLLFLFFFFKKKSEDTGVTFCYLPNCRVLKDIRSKTLLFSKNLPEDMKRFGIDSLGIVSFLDNGSVNFSDSDTKTAPCKYYVITHEIAGNEYQIKVSNCDSTATVTALTLP